MALGKITHYAFDLILISMLFAGIRRDTGYHLDPSQFASYDVRRYVAKYLSYGESAYDYFLKLVKLSGYFTLDRFNGMKRIVGDVNRTIDNANSKTHISEGYTEIRKEDQK